MISTANSRQPSLNVQVVFDERRPTFNFRRSTVLLLALLVLACGSPAVERPSFVFILVDDLGWMDTGVYGSSFYETPNIDGLAADGVLFTQFYTASPVCSPTRASIVTGKHPARLRITNWIGGEQKGRLLQAEYERQRPLEEVTFAEALGEAGYATGYIGKWHLGRAGFLPDSQGFDYTFAVNEAGQPGSYFYPYRNENWPITNVPDLAGDVEGDYLTDRLTDAAVEFIERHRDGPFLLVLSHYSVHTPLQSKPALSAKYEEKASGLAEMEMPAFLPEGERAHTKQRQDHPVYAGMIESTDESVGRVLAILEATGLESNTVVVFVSDNGGLSTLPRRSTSMPTSNVPLRAGKGWLYEGGIRAPMIIKWPGTVAGGRRVDVPTVSMDLYPTLLAMAGQPAMPGQHVDGVNLVPLLREAAEPERAALYWHFPHYHGSGNLPSAAVRVGDLKLVEWLEDGVVELYDLASDPGETTNVAELMPETAEQLRSALQRWRADAGAAMPSPNPDWRPTNRP
jgi:arylsulfatase A-like enzyme